MVVAALTLSACNQGSQHENQHTVSYVTEYGLGPDKWATAWLLTRHAAPQSTLRVVSPNTPLGDGVPFDVPSSEIRRIDNRSAFEVAKSKFNLDEPILNEMASLVYEIEVNFWAAGGPPDADLIEKAYRDLQYEHGRDKVAPECYVAFFDRVYEVLKDSRIRGIHFGPERLNLRCEELTAIAARGRELVPEVPIVDVLSAAAAGRKVVFIDVREPSEYSESHIPGARNIQLRDVRPSLRESLAGADYVVSYCVKDFRGFEMAKALADVGVANSVIMRPYGIKGWVALGLPITGTKSLDEHQAREALASCLKDPQDCLSNEGHAI